MHRRKGFDQWCDHRVWQARAIIADALTRGESEIGRVHVGYDGWKNAYIVDPGPFGALTLS
jgi:hypothetical protein